jgi:serine/threonine protein kinase
MSLENLGYGLSSVCVLNKKLSCKNPRHHKNLKKGVNYVSKIVKKPYSKGGPKEMLEIYLRELYISQLIKENAIKLYSEAWFYNRFSVVEEICNLDDTKQVPSDKCQLEKGIKYAVLFLINSGCKSINIKSSVKFIADNKVIKGRVLTSKKNSYNIRSLKTGTVYKNITNKDLIMECGELDNKSVIHKYLYNYVDFVKAFRYLATSIHFLHTIGISHNDIKPANILADNNGVMRVIDFGSCINILETKSLLKIFCNKMYLKKYIFKYIDAYSVGFVSPEIIVSQYIVIHSKESYNIDKLLLEIHKNCEIKLEALLQNISFFKRILKNPDKFLKDMFCLGTKSGIFKNDVYSLGKTIKYCLKFPNKKLEEIIEKMTTINYTKRPRIISFTN